MYMIIKQSEDEGDNWTDTINLAFFREISILRNFAYAKFRESQTLAK